MARNGGEAQGKKILVVSPPTSLKNYKGHTHYGVLT